MAPLRPEFPALMNRLAGSIPREILEDIHRCSLKRRTGISLSQMMSFRPQQWLRDRGEGDGASARTWARDLTHPLITSARFLQKELPIRFAHRIAELDHLPHGLSDTPHVLKVRNWYVKSFVDLRRLPGVETEADEQRFTGTISRIKARHNLTLEFMARGLAEMKHELQVTQPGLPMDEFPEVHHFLDRFFLSRIGIRMLIGQHVAVHRQMEDARAGRMQEDSTMIGLIDTRCSPVAVAHRAIEDARTMCSRVYGAAPDVQVIGDPSLTFPYVPRHLHQMLLELVANSLRAVHERFSSRGNEAEGALGASPRSFAITTSATSAPSMSSLAASGSSKRPPLIRVVVADGMEDVTIKVSDEGGGIKRSGMPRIWSYLYSTAQSPVQRRIPESSVSADTQDAREVDDGEQSCSSGPKEGSPADGEPTQMLGDSQLQRNQVAPSTLIWSVHNDSRDLNILEEEEEEEERDRDWGDTSAEDEVLRITDEGSERVRGAMAGYGYGLPISRLYARYFGGDLQIFSMEGYGTDAYLHLNRLRNVQEPLP